MEEKLKKLKDYLKKLKRVVIAYSGGVDSTFLLNVALNTLGKENVIAVIGISPTYPNEERKFAVNFCKENGIKYIEVETEEFKDSNFLKNPPDRCFWCKKELFGKIEEIRKNLNFKYIIDGTNKDDEKDYRPGEKAKKIYNVISPLKECGFTKKDIRELSKELNLPTWNKPQMACLASRIPYGEKITEEKLKRINEGEKFLYSLGFKIVRIRDYNELARIEVDKNEIEKLIKFKEKIIEKLKKIGYKYITVDLEGYRTGSMNEVLR
ncbi:MAG TPA: ATP-dependent sacrificial sulfur transferase LarE [bacterium]|nr:ATP-dependent sacrificial sulfur transferase LarE [bacterium]HOM26806.1 ATP-dependent sacrificial sulfur transferase LarE [bacterium]